MQVREQKDRYIFCSLFAVSKILDKNKKNNSKNMAYLCQKSSDKINMKRMSINIKFGICREAYCYET